MNCKLFLYTTVKIMYINSLLSQEEVEKIQKVKMIKNLEKLNH